MTEEAECGKEGCPAAGEGIEDEVAFVGGGEEDAFEEGDGFLGGVLAEFFLPGLGRMDFPDGFHLLAAIGFLHELVVEGVARLGVFRGPDERLGGVGEVAAREIGRRIGLNPGNVVEEFEAEPLHGEADGVDDVGRAGDPDGAVGLEDALAGGEPGGIESMIGIRAAGFVPVAFVDGDHFAGVAGDAAVGEEVGWVGEDEVDGGFGDLREDFEAVALVDAEVVFGVVESAFAQGYGATWPGIAQCYGGLWRGVARRATARFRSGNGFGHVDQVWIVDQPVKQVKARKGSRRRMPMDSLLA